MNDHCRVDDSDMVSEPECAFDDPTEPESMLRRRCFDDSCPCVIEVMDAVGASVGVLGRLGAWGVVVSCRVSWGESEALVRHKRTVVSSLPFSLARVLS